MLPVVSTGAMRIFLDQLSEQVATGAQALLALDRAGWRSAGDLVIPDDITPAFLPPCSPGLSSIDRLWPYLEERLLSNRLWPDHDAIVDAVRQARRRVTNETGRSRSLCSMEVIITVENEWS